MLDDAQRLTLQTHVARDRAEHLLSRVERLFEHAATEAAEAGLTPAERHAREMTLREIVAAARRATFHLDAALNIAELNLQTRRDAA